MRFPPRSDEQLLNLLPDGDYNFVVNTAEDTTSKAGSEMIKLKLHVLDKAGRERIIFDYLLEAIAFKIKHFAYAIGIQDKYEAGCYEAKDCVGRSGRCKIGRDEGSPGYLPKNVIRDYIAKDNAIAPEEKLSPGNNGHILEDIDIPF